MSAESKRIRAELFPTRSLPDLSVPEWRALEVEQATCRLPPPDTCVESRRVGEVPCESIRVQASESGLILYLHGGGYVLGGCNTHRNLVARLAHAAHASALVPEYRLAPENPFPAALEDAVSVYEAVLESGRSPAQLIVAGDSAGGGLAAALLMFIRDNGLPLPAASVLLSPWTDLSLSGASYRTRGELDPVDRVPALHRMVAYYLQKADPRAPLASPLFGDLRGLPPLLIQVGDHEVLLDDSVAFADKARKAAVRVTLEVWPEMWHGWHQAAPDLPEANDAIARIGAYARDAFKPG